MNPVGLHVVASGMAQRMVVTKTPVNAGQTDPWQTLKTLKSPRRFAAGELLFQQGRSPDGIYIIESGMVKLLLTAPRVATKTFELAGPGTVLGLSESVTGEAYKLSVEAVSKTTTSFVERQALLEFLREHHEFCMQVVRLLSEDLHGLYFRFRSLTMSEARSRKRKKIQPTIH